MSGRTRCNRIAGTPGAAVGGCETRVQEQAIAFSRDFPLQCPAAYLL